MLLPCDALLIQEYLLNGSNEALSSCENVYTFHYLLCQSNQMPKCIEKKEHILIFPLGRLLHLIFKQMVQKLATYLSEWWPHLFQSEQILFTSIWPWGFFTKKKKSFWHAIPYLEYLGKQIYPGEHCKRFILFPPVGFRVNLWKATLGKLHWLPQYEIRHFMVIAASKTVWRIFS